MRKAMVLYTILTQELLATLSSSVSNPSLSGINIINPLSRSPYSILANINDTSRDVSDQKHLVTRY